MIKCDSESSCVKLYRKIHCRVTAEINFAKTFNVHNFTNLSPATLKIDE